MRRAFAPSARRRCSSVSSSTSASASAVRVVRRHHQPGLVAHHVPVPGDVRGDHRRRARERPREHHAEALAAERRRGHDLRREHLPRQLLLREEAEHVDAVEPGAGHVQADGERVSPDDAQPGAGARVHVRPGAQQHGQALAPLVAADEEHGVGAVAGVGLRRDEHAVRDHLAVAGRVQLRHRPRRLRDGDARVDAVEQEAPERDADPRPAEAPRRVKGRHDRARRLGERRNADHWREGLVHVHEVELLTLERARDPPDGARAEHDVRERAVRRHDHRAADRDDVGRGRAAPPQAGVEGAREAPDGVVAHDRPGLDPEPAQGVRLQLRVLDDRTPERPRVRDDDPDLHRSGV